MRRALAFLAALMFASAAPAIAQDRPAGHPQHPAGLDSGTHAAIHALLHGSWRGTVESHRAGIGTMDLSVAHDSLMKLMMTVHGQHQQMGPASNFAISGDTLHWTRVVAGAACRVTLFLDTAAKKAPHALKGSMACPDGEVAFNLHRKTQ